MVTVSPAPRIVGDAAVPIRLNLFTVASLQHVNKEFVLKMGVAGNLLKQLAGLAAQFGEKFMSIRIKIKNIQIRQPCIRGEIRTHYVDMGTDCRKPYFKQFIF